MTKASLKDGKRKQGKNKSEESCCRNEKVETDHKHGDKIKEKKKLKRVLPSDEDNRLDDHVERDSNKKRKKRKTERDVKTSELSDSVEDRYQPIGKVKAIKRGKPRVRQQELTRTASSVDSFEESSFTENTYLDSGKEGKELGESIDDEKELFKQKHGKKAKEPEVEAGEKRETKKQIDQEMYQEGDLQNFSGENSVDGEIDKKTKKKKRKKKMETDNSVDSDERNEKFSDDVLGADEEVGTEETDTIKKKKKKKSNPGKESETTTVHPGIDYLQTWYNNIGNWNFKKVRQVWLLQNMFDQELVSKIMQYM